MTPDEAAKTVDWAPHDRWSENTATCACGAVFRSHTKYLIDGGLVSRRPCPACGHHALVRSSSDPEPMTIKG